MQESYDQVKALLDEIGPFFKRAGVHNAMMPTGDYMRIDAQKYIDVYDYLSDVGTSFEYGEVLKAWKLVTPDTWVQYDLFGLTGLQEQTILAVALENFKPLWREKPPGFFGKHFDEENYEDTCDSDD
jgi:hypothetical protein